MKKLIVGMLFAALAACGLVGLSGTSATAADPYPGTVATNITVKAKQTVAVGAKARIKITVKATGSNAKPTGQVEVTVKRVGGGAKFSKRFNNYTGKKVKFSPRITKAGKYKVKVKYIPTGQSVYKPSAGKTTFKATRKS